LLAGDVLLVTGQNKISSGLVAAQKVIYKNSISSHVELSIADGTFVHATGDGGVHITFILDELKSCETNWRVLRLKNIDDNMHEQLMKEGLYFLRQDYNKAFMGSGNEHSSFCSELVAKIYSRAEIPILNGKKPSKVTPADFDREADLLVDWEDVTEEYKQKIQEIEKDPFPYEFACSTIKSSMAKRHMTSKGREAIFSFMENYSEATKKTVEEVKENLKKRELHFWDEKDQE
jgi:hypothetical protein